MSLSIVVILMIAGCAPPELPLAPDIMPVTAVPTEDDSTLCARGQDMSLDWGVRLTALETLYQRSGNCASPVNLLLYNAYLEQADLSESGGDRNATIDLYRSALSYYPEGFEAQNRLDELQNIEPVAEETSEACELPETVDLAPYEASEREFAEFHRDGFYVASRFFPIYGVNYNPLNTPFDRFLTETSMNDLAQELALMRDSGLNTLRIFLRPDDLFYCDTAIPRVDTFERLDTMFRRMDESYFRIIPVLNQDVRPSDLYFDDVVLERMQFIVERYQDEGAILAWDVRDKGDSDYREGFVRRDIALDWLSRAIILVKETDGNHPVTVGFWQDAITTAPLVDFVSFQFYGDYPDLRQEIANLKAATNRPILLASIGYSTFSVSDVAQRDLLYQAFDEIEQNRLTGWMVNHAFDYPRTLTCTPPDCPGSGSELNQFGLWNTSYFPKLAVQAVRLATGVDD